MHWNALPWDFVLILLAITIVVPWRGMVRVRALMSADRLTPSDRIALYGSTIAFQWLATGIIIWRAIARDIGPAALGLAPPRPGAGLFMGIVLALFLATLQLFSLRQLSRVPMEKRGQLYQIAAKLMPQEWTDGLVFVALVGTVSLCEELIFRGFVFAVFQRFSGGSLVLAIVGSSVLFAVGHLYQGRRGATNTFVLGLIFAGARAWSNSLLPPVLAHMAVDLTAGLVGRHAAASTAPSAP